jgi:glycosyltransferase involved in cell wall biosynthesis
MRIVAVNHDVILSADRGLYRTLRSLYNIEIFLVVPSLWQELFGPTRYEPERSPLPVFASRTIFTGRSHRAIYVSLGRILKQVRPDIVWINGEPESYVGCQTVLLRNKLSQQSKVIFSSFRNIDYVSMRFPYKFSFLNAWCERVVLHHADHCIAHNDSAREILLRHGFHNVTVIPPAVDTSVFKRSERSRKEQLGLSRFTIGFVGRFIPPKGVDILLRAARKLDFEYQLLLVGSGPAKSEWLALARDLDIHNRIVWKDPVPHSEVPSLLSAMDVLVLPSSTGLLWKEQFGRVLIEAMACEVPVIGSSSGEIPRVIGDAGLVFREGDESDLCARLSELNANKERRLELIQRGLTRVKERFSIPVVAQQYEKLFHRLIQS